MTIDSKQMGPYIPRIFVPFRVLAFIVFINICLVISFLCHHDYLLHSLHNTQPVSHNSSNFNLIWRPNPHHGFLTTNPEEPEHLESNFRGDGQSELAKTIENNASLYEKFLNYSEEKNVSSHPTSTKYLIYYCVEGRRQLCGGWGDRQRGVVNAFILSLTVGRLFGIIMTRTCNIAHFYLPNTVNWIIWDKLLKGKSHKTINDRGPTFNLSTKLSTLDFNKAFPQDVVYIRTNCNYNWSGIVRNPVYADTVPKWALSKYTSLVFTKAWMILMKPSPRLLNLFNPFLDKVGFRNRTRPFVCAHVRIGKSATFRNDTYVKTNISDVPVLWDFLDGYIQKGSDLFLATDNYQVRIMAKARFGQKLWTTNGSIIHIDRQSQAPKPCHGFGFVLLDQLIMTQCDVLVTSASGFSTQAAYLRGTNKNLFKFIRGKVSTNIIGSS